MRFFIALALALVTVGSAYGEEVEKVATSSAFTYQGQLIDNNVPSNLNADLRFRLYDAAAGGNQVGSTVDKLAVSVVNGIFTVDLNFGISAFDGNARWLQIDVRSPAGSGSYVTMTPRQELTAVPYALHALSGGSGGSGGGQWSVVGSAITNDNAPGFVGINRSSQVTGSEYFGIQAPVSGTSYGGMYIRTDSDTGRPFYGYTTGSAQSAWTYLDGTDDAWKLYNGGIRIGVLTEGITEFWSPSNTPTVVIDTQDPDAFGGQIELFKSNGARTARFMGAGSSGNQGAQLLLYNDTNPASPTAILDGEYGGQAGGALVLANDSGQKGIELVGDTSPGNKALMWMYKPNGTRTFSLIAENNGDPDEGSILTMYSGQGVRTIQLDAVEGGTADQGGTIKLYDDQGNQTIELDGDFGTSGEGRITTEVLEITGGSDLSEQFDVLGDTKTIAPGSVVSIDPASPGDLRVSESAYDRRVAGIISGAGGVRPGMLMGQRGSEADGQHPVALTGRVYCKVDASYGAIEPGDLLTTSDTPGHAMKVTDHAQASGAILGKAMTSLPSGQGEVLVLVSLQ